MIRVHVFVRFKSELLFSVRSCVMRLAMKYLFDAISSINARFSFCQEEGQISNYWSLSCHLVDIGSSIPYHMYKMYISLLFTSGVTLT